MKFSLWTAAVLSIAISPSITLGQEALAPYDSFATPTFTAKKWRTWESLREIKAGKLHLVHRAYATLGTNEGRHFEGRGQFFPLASNVTSMAATVRVDRFESTACRGNPSATFAMARLSGNFFNVGTPTAGSATGDVLADIRIQRTSDSHDPADTLRIVAQLYKCGDAFCSTGESVDFKELGVVKLHQAVKLSIEWDRARHRFLFQRDNQPKVISTYTLADTAPPGTISKALLVEHSVPNCTTAPRPTAFMDASFDDVLVNSSAANPHLLETQGDSGHVDPF